MSVTILEYFRISLSLHSILTLLRYLNFSRLESFHKRLLVIFHLILLDFLLWVYGLIRTNSKINWYIKQELIMDHCEGKHYVEYLNPITESITLL